MTVEISTKLGSPLGKLNLTEPWKKNRYGEANNKGIFKRAAEIKIEA